MKKIRSIPRPAYDVGDRVRTDRGEGIVKFVFPGGMRGKTTYAVRFRDQRVGTVFDEEQVKLVRRRRPRWRAARAR